MSQIFYLEIIILSRWEHACLLFVLFKWFVILNLIILLKIYMNELNKMDIINSQLIQTHRLSFPNKNKMCHYPIQQMCHANSNRFLKYALSTQLQMMVFFNNVFCKKIMKFKAVLVYHFSHFLFYGGKRGRFVLLFVGNSSGTAFKSCETSNRTMGSPAHWCRVWGSALKMAAKQTLACCETDLWLVAKDSISTLKFRSFLFGTISYNIM